MGMDSRVAIFLLATISHAASSVEVIKIGTAVPKSSPWGHVFSVWTDAVTKKSAGQLEVQFFYNGQQGDEVDMAGKMKSGQLDGALMTAVGLSRIYMPILALQMPGLFTNWSKLESARQAMSLDFIKGFEDAGFSLLGWIDYGAVHLMSKGVTVRAPGDIRGKKPVVDRYNPIERLLYQVIGGVTPVSLGTSEVLPNLNMGAVSMVHTSSLLAEQWQWSPKLDTISEGASGLVTGGFVISTKRLNALSSSLRTILLDTVKVATDSLGKGIHDADDAAFSRLQSKMRVITLTADELSQWNTIYKEVHRRLAQGTFSPDLVAKLEQLAN